ncbi:hypothetical protein [Cytobacillus firmus]|uniref:hypothetical protein n=1 Tax=Cytobacillus firmus TaxID=1399 RepID=UPI0018CD69D1|nr:hypothetical protein [Cytobacillus firmus]MED1942118.1 hypothetical protein [Cytobacillus firmus]
MHGEVGTYYHNAKMLTKKMKAFLLSKGFLPQTLDMLNFGNLEKLAKEYNFEA